MQVFYPMQPHQDPSQIKGILISTSVTVFDGTPPRSDPPHDQGDQGTCRVYNALAKTIAALRKTWPLYPDPRAHLNSQVDSHQQVKALNKSRNKFD